MASMDRYSQLPLEVRDWLRDLKAQLKSDGADRHSTRGAFMYEYVLPSIRDGVWNVDAYSLGLANGLLCAAWNFVDMENTVMPVLTMPVTETTQPAPEAADEPEADEDIEIAPIHPVDATDSTGSTAPLIRTFIPPPESEPDDASDDDGGFDEDDWDERRAGDGPNR